MRKKRFTAFLLSMAMAGTSLYTCGVIDVQAAAVAEDQAENPNLEQLAEIQEQAAAVEEDGAETPDMVEQEIEEPEQQAGDISFAAGIQKISEGKYKAPWGTVIQCDDGSTYTYTYKVVKLDGTESKEERFINYTTASGNLGEKITIKQFQGGQETGAVAEVEVVQKELTEDMITVSTDGLSYNGSPIEPKLTVKDADGNELVRYNGGYRIVDYDNNTDPGTARVKVKADADDMGVAGGILYTGECWKDFVITKRNITSVNVKVDPISLNYTGEAVIPEPDTIEVTDINAPEVKLRGADYTIKWTNAEGGSAVSVGSVNATVRLTRDGYFTSSGESFDVANVFDIISNDSATFTPSFKDNNTQFPIGTSANGVSENLVVKVGNSTVSTDDYTIVIEKKDGTKIDSDWSADLGRGDYIVKIAGRHNYAATVKGEIGFTIAGTSISADGISVNLEREAYISFNGAAHKPTVKVSINGFDDNGGEAHKDGLVENVDYTLAWKNNINASTASVSAEVIVRVNGDYTGNKTVSFNIEKADISQNAKVSVVNKKLTYNGDWQAPKYVVSVDFSNRGGTLQTLTSKDYTLVTASSNAQAGIVSGSAVCAISANPNGNYTGSINGLPELSYEIERKDISDNDMIWDIKDKYNYAGEEHLKPNFKLQYGGLINSSNHQLAGPDDNTLIEGRDYYVELGENNNIGDEGSVKVIGSGNYIGTLYATFEIAGRDFTHVVVSDNDEVSYNGKTLSEADLHITVYSGSTSINHGQYTVSLGDPAPKDAGSYTLWIQGKNDYEGKSISHNYVVTRREFISENISVGEMIAYTYKGGRDTPKAVVSDNLTKEILTENKDYKVTFETSTSDCTLTGLGNYTDKVIKTTYKVQPGEFEKIDITASSNDVVYEYTAEQYSIDIKNLVVRDADHDVDLELYKDYYTGAMPSVTKAGLVWLDIIAHPQSAYTGTKKVSFNILPKSISSDDVVQIRGIDYTDTASYTGEETEYVVPDELKTDCLSFNGEHLSTNDYDVMLRKGNTLSTNYKDADEYDIVAVAKKDGNYIGERRLGTLTVEKAILSASDFRLSEETYEYTGVPCTPRVIPLAGHVEGMDYDVTYEEDMISRGRHVVTVSGINNYTGIVKLVFVISPITLSDGNTEIFYAGTTSDNMPKIQVTVNGKALVLNEDYTYTAVAEEGSDPQAWVVTISGCDAYEGSHTERVEVGPISILSENVTVSCDFTYTGEKQVPAQEDIIVTVFGETLTLGTDYTISINGDSVDAGEYEVTVTGEGDYIGTVKGIYEIKPATFTQDDVTIQSSVEYTGSTVNPVTIIVGGKKLVLNQDYTVTPEEGNMEDAGEKTLKIEGIGNYAGSEVTGTCTITAASLKDAKVTVQSVTYTGSAQKAKVTLVVKNRLELREGIDYTVESKSATNAGTVDVKVTGKGNYTGTAIGKFTINPRDLSKGAISGIKNRTYNKGKAVTQPSSLKIVVNNKTLKKGTDYTVSYKNNKNIGQASFTIKGKGNYKGTTVAKTFNIYPKKSTIQSLKAGSKRFTVQVKKQKKGITYQIQYKVKGSKSYTRIETKNAKKVIKGLRKGKTYTVRVRTFETVKKVRYYGEFSKAKNVKIKK